MERAGVPDVGYPQFLDSVVSGRCHISALVYVEDVLVRNWVEVFEEVIADECKNTRQLPPECEALWRFPCIHRSFCRVGFL